LVEQSIRNRQVSGSSPDFGSKIFQNSLGIPSHQADRLLPIPGRTPAQTNVVAAMVAVVIINMSNRRVKTESFPHFRS
jgi:hypothetical protein